MLVIHPLYANYSIGKKNQIVETSREKLNVLPYRLFEKWPQISGLIMRGYSKEILEKNEIAGFIF